MQLTSILVPLVMLASLVAASPLEARGTRVTAVDAGKPEFSPADATPKASVAAHIEGEQSTTGVSKRTDFNALDERSGAVLIVCTSYGCGGSCYGYSLDIPPWTCYGTYWFNSVYVSNGGAGLPYGVYVGSNCRGSHSSYNVHVPWPISDILYLGVLVPRVDTCYNIQPTSNTYFIN
jgi:hypothetical protein